MTSITRRKFLSLAPASVGAIALGALALPEPVPDSMRTASGLTVADLRRARDTLDANDLDAMSQTMLAAGQRAVDPPVLSKAEVLRRKDEFVRAVMAVTGA